MLIWQATRRTPISWASVTSAGKVSTLCWRMIFLRSSGPRPSMCSFEVPACFGPVGRMVARSFSGMLLPSQTVVFFRMGNPQKVKQRASRRHAIT
jgi:hypothetical protein